MFTRSTTYIRAKRDGEKFPVFFLLTDGGAAWVTYNYASDWRDPSEAADILNRLVLRHYTEGVADIRLETHHS